MRHTKLAAIAAISLLCLSSSFAFAANNNGGGTADLPPTGPGPSQAGDLPRISLPLGGGDEPAERPTGDGGQVNRDNNQSDPNSMLVGKMVLKLSPYSIECRVMRDAYKPGMAEIWFQNSGTETIPAGSIITVKYPDGTTEKFEVLRDIEPGASSGIIGPAGSNDEGFSCKATVKVKPVGLDNPTIGH